MGGPGGLDADLGHDVRVRHHRRERLAHRAHQEALPRRQLSFPASAGLLLREQQQALHALVHPVRDRRVHGQHEPGSQPEPEARVALLLDDLARDGEEGVLVGAGREPGGGVDGGAGGGGAGARAVGAADLLAGSNDGDGDGEDLGERAGDGTQQQLGSGGERGEGGAFGCVAAEASDVGVPDEGVEEEVGVF